MYVNPMWISYNTIFWKVKVPDQEVAIVTKYTYLGTVFDNKLTWIDNFDSLSRIVSRAFVYAERHHLVF